jgi:hypothetical protein
MSHRRRPPAGNNGSVTQCCDVHVRCSATPAGGRPGKDSGPPGARGASVQFFVDVFCAAGGGMPALEGYVHAAPRTQALPARRCTAGRGTHAQRTRAGRAPRSQPGAACGPAFCSNKQRVAWHVSRYSRTGELHHQAGLALVLRRLRTALASHKAYSLCRCSGRGRTRLRPRQRPSPSLAGRQGPQHLTHTVTVAH